MFGWWEWEAVCSKIFQSLQLRHRIFWWMTVPTFSLSMIFTFVRKYFLKMIFYGFFWLFTVCLTYVDNELQCYVCNILIWYFLKKTFIINQWISIAYSKDSNATWFQSNIFLSNHALNIILNFNFSKSGDIKLKFIILEIVFSIPFFQLCIAGTEGMYYIRLRMKLRLQRC